MTINRLKVPALAVAWSLASVAPALADDVPDEATEVRTYHRQTLAVDAVGMGLFLAGAAAEGEGGRDTAASDVLFPAGAATLVLGAPIVHATHGQWGRAGASLGLRGGLVGLGMLAGFAIADQTTEDDGSLDGGLAGMDGVGPGALVGAAVASVLDAAFLARETVEVDAAPILTPTIAPVGSGAAVGVAGAF